MIARTQGLLKPESCRSEQKLSIYSIDRQPEHAEVGASVSPHGALQIDKQCSGPTAVVKTLVVRLSVGGSSKVGPRARMLPETTDRITGPFILTSRHSSNSSLPASTVTMKA